LPYFTGPSSLAQAYFFVKTEIIAYNAKQENLASAEIISLKAYFYHKIRFTLAMQEIFS
jgi:hypothetical protein